MTVARVANSGPDTGRPFRDAIRLTALDGDRYAGELGPRWTVGSKAHGGLLLVLVARAALARLSVDDGDASARDPLAVAADFLRAPDPGPVELRTEVLKRGRTASVVAVRMLQEGRPVLAATVTAGRLPADAPRWAELPELPAQPTADAVDPRGGDGPAGLADACQLRWDRSTFAFAEGAEAPPVLRGWVRPRGEPTDVLFALLAGDILPPTVFNLGGGVGWAPTVQLTALLRARPAPGWLRMEARSRVVAGGWFDEDVTVIDEAGALVCQARQLALAPLRPTGPGGLPSVP
jgi:hypothetical protein